MKLRSPVRSPVRAAARTLVDSGHAAGSNLRVRAPRFAPAPGGFGPAQDVTITCPTSGADIFYTTNGSTPTSGSTAYVGPVHIAATTTLKAIAIKSGLTDSPVRSGTYTINGAVATPTFNPVAGAYALAQSVTISCATAGASIYYTTDGSAPTTSSTPYTTPVTVSATSTLKALAAKTGYSNSAVGSAAYTIGLEFPQTMFTGGEKGAVWNASNADARFQDTSGTTPAGVGDYVALQSDESGNGYDLKQATLTARLQVVQDGNGKYGLVGDGVDDNLHCDTVSLVSAECYVALAVSLPASGSDRIFSTAFEVDGTDYDDWTHFFVSAQLSGTNGVGLFRNFATCDSGLVIFPGTAPVIIEAWTDATSEHLRVTFTDHLAVMQQHSYSNSITATSSLSLAQFALLAATQGGNNIAATFYGGLIIDRIPASDERDDVVDWLNGLSGAFA
jgi:hypothetical protein